MKRKQYGVPSFKVEQTVIKSDKSKTRAPVCAVKAVTQRLGHSVVKRVCKPNFDDSDKSYVFQYILQVAQQDAW